MPGSVSDYALSVPVQSTNFAGVLRGTLVR